MADQTLIADIGGTNARFAVVRHPGVPESVRSLPVSGHSSFDAALDAYMAVAAVDPASLAGMAIAAAGPVLAGRVRLTNTGWHLDQAALSARFGGIPVRLINDVAAVALALPFLAAGDLLPVQTGELCGLTREPLPLLAINAGTGLGAAVAVPTETGWTALATEAGHMRLAAVDEAQLALFRGLETVEDLLAGPGWQRFETHRQAGAPSPGDAPEAARLYAQTLGRFAGDMVLATGAWGGVYFCGGVLNEWDTLIDRDALLASFSGHGPMSALLGAVPMHRILSEDPALAGLARMDAR